MVIKMQLPRRQHFTPPPPQRGYEELVAKVLENYCWQRFACKIKTANSKVKPIFFYCVSRTGMDWKFFRRRWGVCENTYRRYRSQGEMLAMRTMAGKKFYNEMMTLITTAVKEKKYVTLMD